MKQQNFVIEGQLVELGQAAELTLGMLPAPAYELGRTAPYFDDL